MDPPATPPAYLIELLTLWARAPFVILESRMKPQDLAIALSLASPEPPETYAALATMTGLSTSEAHACVRRLREAGLVDADRTVRRAPLLDFLTHGLRVVFPVAPASMTLGVPTGAAVFPDEDDLPESEPRGVPWVWPAPDGSARGMAVTPLYPSLPAAVVEHPWLHQTLAILDLLRAGRVREIRWARSALARRLGDRTVPPVVAVDPSSPEALSAIFSRRRISLSISRWLRERAHPLIEHPLVRPILAEYRDQLAQHLAEAVPAGTFHPSPARHVVGDKGSGGARDWTFPSIVDGLVGRRLIDELEPRLRGSEDRAFVARARTSSLNEPGDYDRGREWQSFVASLRAAADGMAVALSTDVHEFFASVDHALARQIVAQRSGAHPRVVHLLFSLLRAWLPLGRVDGRGLPIEPHDVSRLVAHAVLRTVDDDFEEGFDLRYRRFMDDTVIFCEQLEDVARIRERHRRALAMLGMAPNEQKTEVFSDPQELLARYDDPTDAPGFVIRDFRNVSKKSLRAATAMQRRLYRNATRRDNGAELVDHALRHVRWRSLRDSALWLLEHQTLGPEEVEVLQAEVARSDRSPEARLQVLGTLARARVEHGEELASWCWEMLDRVGPYAQAALLLVLFKHDENADGERLARWASDPRHTDPLLRSTLEYVLRALGVDEGRLPRWPAIDGDAGWARRLLDDIAARRLQNAERLLWSLRARQGGSWTIRPEHLPLVRILACVPDAPWRNDLEHLLRDVRATTADTALRSHVERALTVMS